MSTGYLSLGRRPGGEWAKAWNWTKRFTVLFSNRKYQQPQVLTHFLPYRIPRGGKIGNTIIVLCIDDIICVNYSNAVNNVNFGSLWGLILPFKVVTGARKDFLEIYRKVEHMKGLLQNTNIDGMGTRPQKCSPALSCANGRGGSFQGVKLTTHLYLLRRLWANEAVPLLRIFVFRM
jgi:hypothetical protein